MIGNSPSNSLGAFMEISKLGKAALWTTAATGFTAAMPVNANESCLETNQNNVAQYDINELIYGESCSVRTDIAIHVEGYAYNPVASYQMNSALLDGDIAPEDDLSNATEEQNAVVDVSDMFARVKEIFGLNAVQMSQAARVSRPTLYNHLKGKDCDQSLVRYQELYTLANEVSRQLEVDIRKGLKSVLVDGKTLLSYLKEEELDHDKILEVSHSIANKLANSSSSTKEVMSAKHQIRSSRSVSNFG